MTPNTMPVLFVGHGSPMNAIEDNAFTRGWRDAAARLPTPRAILCVSAHWETAGVWACANAQPPTIHDFHGFPQALFDVRYPAPGDPALARRVVELVTRTPVRTTADWGLDHGAWSVLQVMYPRADIPVVQLSLDTSQPGAFHLAVARELAPLRDEGVLILASGNVIHNIEILRNDWDGAPAGWEARFAADLDRRLAQGDHAGLIAYDRLGRDAALAIPTPDHYLPLLYALGLQRSGERVETLVGGADGDGLGMLSIAIR